MEEEVLVSGDSTVGRLLKWLSGFTRRAIFRKELGGIYFDEQCIVASDGFCIAAIPTPDGMKELAGKLLDPRIPSWRSWKVMWPVIREKFPNFPTVLPKADERPLVKTVFDSKLLLNTLQGFALQKDASDRAVMLSLYRVADHPEHPNGGVDCMVVIQSANAYAVAMGMWSRADSDSMKNLFEPKPDVSRLSLGKKVKAVEPGGSTREHLIDPAPSNDKP